MAAAADRAKMCIRFMSDGYPLFTELDPWQERAVRLVQHDKSD
jgi:hypothetical protein